MTAPAPSPHDTPSDSKPSRFPDALVLIFAMIIVAQLLTYVLPAGAFEREAKLEESTASERVLLPEGGEVLLDGAGLELPADARELVLPVGTSRESNGRKVVPGTYHKVEAERLAPHAFLTLLPKGLEAAADIIFFVLLIGGVIAVIKATGAFDALISECLLLLGGRPGLLVAGMTALFAVGSSTIGMAEEYMPFVPILVGMCIALRMDAIVAMGIVYVGAGVGYGAAALNPFTVIIAQDIAGLAPGSGSLLRWSLLLVMITVSVHHILRYAKRIQEDPGRSLVKDIDYSAERESLVEQRISFAQGLILAMFALMIAVFVWGVKAHGWYLVELAALFLATGLVAAAIARLSPNRTAREFTIGASELASTALLIGFARTIEVVLTEAQVIDTVIYGIASVLEQAEGLGGAAKVVSAWGMLGVQSVCNFLIPSGSGQAYVTMPIMAPLADLTGLNRESAVLAYQLGDGLMNMVVPTNALLMGMLLLAKVPYQRWIRFIFPLMLKLYAIALLALALTA